MSTELEKIVQDMTVPINGQYPRPWITSLPDPTQAKLFIVGLNQATTYGEGNLSHERHINALFNRNGESCRRLYDEIRSSTGRKSSPTRRNTDKLVKHLNKLGVEDVLETDVICYSTRRYKDLKDPSHQAGKQRGEELFQKIIDEIRPPFLVSHGVTTTQALGVALGVALPKPAATAEKIIVHPVLTNEYSPLVFIIPSLTPQPGIVWTDHCFERLADEISASFISYYVSQKFTRTTAEKIKWHQGKPIN